MSFFVSQLVIYISYEIRRNKKRYKISLNMKFPP